MSTKRVLQMEVPSTINWTEGKAGHNTHGGNTTALPHYTCRRVRSRCTTPVVVSSWYRNAEHRSFVAKQRPPLFPSTGTKEKHSVSVQHATSTNDDTITDVLRPSTAIFLSDQGINDLDFESSSKQRARERWVGTPHPLVYWITFCVWNDIRARRAQIFSRA